MNELVVLDLNEIVTVNQAIGAIIVAQLLPLIVGFVTERTAGALQSWLLLFLSAVVVVVEEAVTAGSFTIEAVLLRFFALWGAAVLSYKGWQKETIAPAIQARGLHLGGPQRAGAP